MAASVEVVKPCKQYDEVVVHPLVLLSVVDHFGRVEEVRAPPACRSEPRPSPGRCQPPPTLPPPSLQTSEGQTQVGVPFGEYRKGRLDADQLVRG